MSDMHTAPVHEVLLDEPNQLSRLGGWEIDFRQLQAGDMQTKVVLRPGNNVSLLELHMSRGVHQRGTSPVGALTLGLPVTPALHNWNGNPIETPDLVNFGMGREFDAVNGANFAGLTITISEAFLARVSDRLGTGVPPSCFLGAALPLRRKSASVRGLVALGRSLLHRPEAPFDATAQEDLVTALLCALDGAEPVLDGTSSLRARSVKAAIAHIREHAREQIETPILISDLCALTGVSWRTLERGFQEQFGMSPKAYLNRFRLTGARADLLRGETGGRIADIANRWGFWHMGQFAKDYHRMFGERPSDTRLKNS